jgi:hypothetical protein
MPQVSSPAVCSLVTGNHDLEGMDEFGTDEENLQAWMDHFGLGSPSFCHQVGNTLKK